MNIKTFTIKKVGYTCGIYGCSNEYFCLDITNDRIKTQKSFLFSGMYGAENRIENILKEKGYTEIYTKQLYGKLTRKDIPKKWVVSEYELTDLLKYYK